MSKKTAAMTPLAILAFFVLLLSYAGTANADALTSGWWGYATKLGYTACGASTVDQAGSMMSHTYSAAGSSGCSNFVYGSYGGSAILYGRANSGASWQPCSNTYINADGTYWAFAYIPVQYSAFCAGSHQFTVCGQFEVYISGPPKLTSYAYYPLCSPVDYDGGI